MNIITLCLLFSCLASVCYSENETFVATKEWQEIKPGQSIPKGLHVRINLESGKKEAKLLDEDGDERTELSSVPENVEEPPEKKDWTISKTLEDTLKNLPKGSLGIEYDANKMEKIKKDYKTYDELKRSFNAMRMNFKTDAEIISELIKEYKNLTNVESNQADVIRILDNFSYLVHQIDNALWFIDEGGLDLILLPTIVNNTNTALRVQSMRILGALAQNNPKAKISVYEKNFVSHLSRILITSASTDELSTALYALGSILRKFPHAQKQTFFRSGVRAFITVLRKECEIKIKAKVLTLISDLIVERDYFVANGTHQEATQYDELKFEEWLHSNEYCQTVNGAFSVIMYDLIEQPDIMEYFIQALETTEYICRRFWSESAQLRHSLLTIMNRYLHSNEEYRLEMAKLLHKLIRLMFKTATVESRDEL